MLLLRRPTNGVTDMVLPSTPNKTALFAACEEQWGAGVVPRPQWEEHQFGGPNVGASSTHRMPACSCFALGRGWLLGLAGRSSNIFLSAGHLDPWRAGSIAESELPKDNDPSLEVGVNINVRLLYCAALRARLARLSLSRRVRL